MAKMLFTLAATLLLAACASEPHVQNTAQLVPESLPLLSDAGQASCTIAGGEQSTARQLDGTLESVCTFPNGKRCGDAALQDGGCG